MEHTVQKGGIRIVPLPPANTHWKKKEEKKQKTKTSLVRWHQKVCQTEFEKQEERGLMEKLKSDIQLTAPLVLITHISLTLQL